MPINATRGSNDKPTYLINMVNKTTIAKGTRLYFVSNTNNTVIACPTSIPTITQREYTKNRHSQTDNKKYTYSRFAVAQPANCLRTQRAARMETIYKIHLHPPTSRVSQFLLSISDIHQIGGPCSPYPSAFTCAMKC